MLKDLAPCGFQGMGYIGERSLIVLTKGFRVMVSVMVSTDWSSLGSGLLISAPGPDISLGISI